MGHREGSWPKLVTFRSTLEGCPFKVGPNDRAHIAICESGAFVCAAPKDQRVSIYILALNKESSTVHILCYTMVAREDQTSSFNPTDENSKKSWTRKLKLIKNSSFGSKLKSSRAYVKSFFSKSGCSNEYSANFDKGSVPMAKEHSYNVKEAKKEPFGQIQKGAYSKGMNKENVVDQDHRGRHRRSFSGAIKRFSTAKSSSSTS
uniref:Probable membrane-associated kinase regulator 4 n=1 Tax=Nicotiana sylvestris TaxID=4096 RepID=A0A1U7V8S8_NICSY